MLPTLQGYIFRQLIRTFLFALVSLVLIFVLGGGFAVFVRGSASPLAAVGIVLPIAATLMTPVALLLATTMTFGRLSADNELDACRAAGVNLHRLLLVPALLALIASGVVAYSICQWIPRYLGSFTGSLQRDMQQQLKLRLELTNSFQRDNYSIFADTIDDPRGDASELRLTNTAFLEYKQSQLTRYGSAERAVVNFSTELQRVSITLYDVLVFDMRLKQWGQVKRQPFGPFDLRELSAELTAGDVKWKAFDDLLAIRDDPMKFEEVRAQHTRIVEAVTAALAYNDLSDRIRRGEPIELVGDDMVYDIRVERPQDAAADWQPLKQWPPDAHPVLYNATIRALRRSDRSEVAQINTPRLGLHVVPALSTQSAGRWRAVAERTDDAPVRVLYRETVSRQPQGLSLGTYDLEPTELSADYQQQARNLVPFVTDVQPIVQGQFSEAVDRQADKLFDLVLETYRQIHAEINFRLSYSISTLLLVPLGACLGIRFRGAHVLTAFALAALPGLLVVLGILVGRNMVTESPQMELGTAFIWAGNVICLALLMYAAGWLIRR